MIPNELGNPDTVFGAEERDDREQANVFKWGPWTQAKRQRGVIGAVIRYNRSSQAVGQSRCAAEEDRRENLRKGASEEVLK
jgi:hypothetical protein